MACACARGACEAEAARPPPRAPRLAPFALPAGSRRSPGSSTSSKGEDMKRLFIAAIACLALTVGASPAAADSGLGGLVDTATQTAQQNTNAAGDATASNENGTSQSNDQAQFASGGDATTGDATTGSACCGSAGNATSSDAYGGDIDQSQTASNRNDTSQHATAE